MDGIPYGVPIEAAPALPNADLTALWAFVVAGDLIHAPTLPPGTRVRVVNERTAVAFDTPLHPNGRFIGAFADDSQADVIAESDLLTIQLVSDDGRLLGQPTRRRIDDRDLRYAFATVAVDALPPEARLLPNFPNPFNPETWIPFELRDPANVTIRIYTPAGALVRTLDLGRQASGYHVTPAEAAHWNGMNSAMELVASGVYVCELEAGSYRDVRRLLLAK